MSASSLLALARRLHEATSLPEVMDHVVDAVSEATRYRRAWLILPLEQGLGIDVVGYALADRERVNQRMSSLDWRKDRLISLEMSRDETLVIPDIRLCPDADQVQVEYFGNRTVVAIPMLWLGERLGCFNLGTFAAEGVMPPTEAELEFAEEVAALISVVAGRVRAEAKVRQLNAELERRIAERTAQLEVANRELDAFAHSVSHDLRAPLRHIAGFADLLRRRLESTPDEKSRHYLATITASVERMGRLIDDVLSFSRMGRQEFSQTRVDLGALLQEAIRELALEIGGRTIDWRVAALPIVTGDRAMLRVVFDNLLSNAVKFTRPRAEAQVEIGCREEGSELLVFVRDNGVGFDPRHADKLFGAFQRMHPQEEFEGTGIGLANVRRVIARHGGRTWAEARVGEGATFYFSLPREPGSPAPG